MEYWLTPREAARGGRTLLYRSLANPVFPLHVDTSIYATGMEYDQVRLIQDAMNEGASRAWMCTFSGQYDLKYSDGLEAKYTVHEDGNVTLSGSKAIAGNDIWTEISGVKARLPPTLYMQHSQ